MLFYHLALRLYRAFAAYYMYREFGKLMYGMRPDEVRKEAADALIDAAVTFEQDRHEQENTKAIGPL